MVWARPDPDTYHRVRRFSSLNRTAAAGHCAGEAGSVLSRWAAGFEDHDNGSPSAGVGRRRMKRADARVPFEKPVKAVPQDAFTLSMDDADAGETLFEAGLQVILDQHRQLRGPKGVQVQNVGDR